MRILREALALGALLFQIAVVGYYWKQLPQQIPIHFDGAGNPDSYGDKSTTALVPAITFFLYGMLTILSFFPDSFNYPVTVTDENRARVQAVTLAMLGWLKAELVCLMAYINWAAIRVGLGRSAGLGWAMLPIGLGAIGATIAIGIVYTRRAAKPTAPGMA